MRAGIQGALMDDPARGVEESEHPHGLDLLARTSMSTSPQRSERASSSEKSTRISAPLQNFLPLSEAPPVFAQRPLRITDRPYWLGHVPFVMWLIEQTKPDKI